MITESYKTIDGVECVTWTDEQGTHSMLKSAYDTLPSNSADPVEKPKK